MKQKLLYFLFIAVYMFITSCKSSDVSDNSYGSIKEAFLNPPPEARPKAYWWCLNGNIDTLTVREELLAMKEIGITGFDLFEIGANVQDSLLIPAGPAFMSDTSLQLIKYAVDQAGKLGLTVGISLSSSWNAGGSWVKPEHGGKSLYYAKTEIEGNSSGQKLKLPFPKISFPHLIGGVNKSLISFHDDGKPEYYEEIAILAIPARTGEEKIDTTKIIDITPFFDPATELLTWDAPQGKWDIYRYVCSNSGQQVVLPSPKSAGLTIDHFDADAVETHLMFFINRLQSVLGDISATALKNFYLASYEARGLVWTPTLPETFKALSGYEIQKLLPAFFNPEMFNDETVAKMQSDFKQTLSELMINNLYKKSQEICNRHGLRINSEAGGPGYPLYNGPADPLKAQGTIDIPRGEFWINHSRFYQDENDSIDVLRIVKETSAASHIYEKGTVEMEAFTSFMHWQEGPDDMKPFGDRAFCEGMNRIVFHGFSHNISNSGYPGFVYYAGTHFNNKRVWWPKAKPFVDYLARISAVFQKVDFKADVVWYYGDKVPNAARPKNTHFKVGDGYDYEVINTDVLLNRLTVKNGKLALPNGAEFSLLVLEKEEFINPEVQVKLDELAKKGAVIIQSDRSALEELQKMGVQPDIDYIDKESGVIDYIHFGKDNTDIYFIRNTQNEWISRNIRFRQQNKSPELWDPVSGKIIPLPVFHQDGTHITFPLSLPPFGSYIVAFRNDSRKPQFTHISGEGPTLPIFEYTAEGLNMLENGSFTLSGSKQTIPVDNTISQYPLDGAWEVSFTKDWGAPEKAVFPELISWTESGIEGIKYYSGIGTYEKSFDFSENPAATGKKYYLDLGKIAKVADVWLNGQHLGISWTAPHRFEITDIVKQEQNLIRIEIANTWSNRLTGDALTGEKFTNSNIKATIIPAPTMETGDQTRYPWARVPLIESGLIGPVTIQGIIPININN